MEIYDAAIIGAGPAGMTAGIYLARARRRVVMLEKEQVGGQMALSAEIENYPGAEKQEGPALAERMRKQAEDFGVEFRWGEAEKLELDGAVKTVVTDQGEIRCRQILLATGAAAQQAGFRGESEYRGRGVSYCATCDGRFFTGQQVFVVGGGTAAVEEAIYLTRFAEGVTMVIRRDGFSCPEAVAQRAREHGSITVMTQTVVEEISGDTRVQMIRCRNTESGRSTTFTAAPGKYFGVFVFVGQRPASELVQGLAECDANGYVVTEAGGRTGVDGLFAAGDVCSGRLHQIAAAVGDGAAAAVTMEQELPLRPEQV